MSVAKMERQASAPNVVAKKEKRNAQLKEVQDRVDASYKTKADRKSGKKYWEECGMPLRIVNTVTGDSHLAEKGEMPEDDEVIHPYSMWSTAAFNSKGGDFKEFGIGLGLYFKSEVVFCCLLFVMMLITVPSIAYYGSDEYSKEQLGTDILNDDITAFNPGTAACTEQMFTWMSHKYGPNAGAGPIALGGLTSIGTYNPTWELMGGAVRNTCLLNETQGYLDLLASILFIVFIFGFGCFIDHQIEEMDESVQTTQDYSVCVADPPPDAKECDEWKDYFSQFGVVAAVTVAIDNTKILKALGREKDLRRAKKLEQLYDDDEALGDIEDDEKAEAFVACCRATKVCAFFADVLQAAGVGRDMAWCDRELEKNKAALEEALKEEHDHAAMKVYVTFDTEHGQRRCLNELKVGWIPALMDKVPASWEAKNVAEQYKFRGQHILQVNESAEPSEIMWHNLGTKRAVLYTQMFITGVITISLVAIAAVVIKAGTYPAIMAILISVFNCALPEILKVIQAVETHDVFNDSQQSLLIKLLLARLFCSSFVLTFIVIDYEVWLTNQAYASITGVMLAEAVTTPLIHFGDFSTLGKQIVLGPFAKTQAAMNLLWSGSVWTLSERYTDLVKSIFTGLFFMSIVPVGLVFSCMALFVCYWVDKYLLLRKWKQVPKIGGDLAKDSQTYLLLAIVAHFMFSTVFYSSFTYDHVCAIDVDCMNAGGYSDAEVDKCYIPDSHQLFDSYRNSDLYKYAGDEATTFAKIAFENEVRNNVYSATSAGDRKKALFAIVTNTTRAILTETCKSGEGMGTWETKYNTDLKYCGADDLVEAVYGGAPTAPPTAYPTDLGGAQPTGAPTAPTAAPSIGAPTEPPTSNPTSGADDPIPTTWLNGDGMANHQFRYFKDFNKDSPHSGESSAAAWVWCDKRAQDNFKSYFLEDAPGWMAPAQKKITELFSGVTTFGVVVVLGLAFALKFYNMFKFLFVGTYSPTGDVQGIDFVDCDDIQAYIPEWKQAGFEFPFVACDLSAGHIPTEYLSYEVFDYTPQLFCRDAAQGEEAHYPDIVGLNKERSRMGKPIFSPMKMYVNEIIESGVKSSEKEGMGTSSAPVNLEDIEAQLDSVPASS